LHRRGPSGTLSRDTVKPSLTARTHNAPSFADKPTTADSADSVSNADCADSAHCADSADTADTADCKRRKPGVLLARVKETSTPPGSPFDLKSELELLNRIDGLSTRVERINDTLDRLINEIAMLTTRLDSSETGFHQTSKRTPKRRGLAGEIGGGAHANVDRGTLTPDAESPLKSSIRFFGRRA
jgi:hypothetical protein